MKINRATTQLIVLGSARFVPGYWRGMRQPAVLVRLRLTRLEVAAQTVHRFDELMHAVAASPDGGSSELLLNTAAAQHPVLSRVINLALVALNKMGMPVMGGASALKSEGMSKGEWLIGLPAIAQGIHAPQAALNFACTLMSALDAGKSTRTEELIAAITKLANRYRPLAPAGVNTLQFLQAAHEMGIPWRHVANNVYQFGWGSRSRWLDSSFTDETSTISAGLARDKVACAKVLRAAGLPVPRHQLVTSAEQAVKVADALGYPVVVKPANLDGGKGVMAGLPDAEAVSSAFASAVKLSPRVLVEQFIEGNDYRIRVCTGEVIGAVIRKPAAVVGDGASSVRALIDSVNNERAKLTRPLDPEVEQGSKPIVADDEVQRWLGAQGLNLDSVVPPGQKVRLRGAANVSLGGTTWEVTQEAHPDNLALALDATAALRLDVAGIDLLLPDIARSWKETGGAVCEVNSQPQFSSGSAHRKVLERLVRHQGRIPVVGIMQACIGTQTLESLVQELEQDGVRVYLASTVLQCQQAFRCADADAVIWQLDNLLLPAAAVPIDRLSLLIQPGTLSAVQASAPFSVVDCWALCESPDLQQVTERLSAYLREACMHIEKG